MNGKLFAFKPAGSGSVWILCGNGRAWMRTTVMAGQHQVDMASVAIVDAASPLWLLPVIGPTP